MNGTSRLQIDFFKCSEDSLITTKAGRQELELIDELVRLKFLGFATTADFLRMESISLRSGTCTGHVYALAAARAQYPNVKLEKVIDKISDVDVIAYHILFNLASYTKFWFDLGETMMLLHQTGKELPEIRAKYGNEIGEARLKDILKFSSPVEEMISKQSTQKNYRIRLEAIVNAKISVLAKASTALTRATSCFTSLAGFKDNFKIKDTSGHKESCKSIEKYFNKGAAFLELGIRGKDEGHSIGLFLEKKPIVYDSNEGVMRFKNQELALQYLKKLQPEIYSEKSKKSKAEINEIVIFAKAV